MICTPEICVSDESWCVHLDFHLEFNKCSSIRFLQSFKILEQCGSLETLVKNSLNLKWATFVHTYVHIDKQIHENTYHIYSQSGKKLL